MIFRIHYCVIGPKFILLPYNNHYHNMNTTRMLKAWLIATMALVAAACSHNQSEILDTIPAESGFIARINAENLLESAGFSRNGDEWEAGKVVDALLSELSSKDRLEIEQALNMTKAVDAGNVFLFSYENDSYLTCLVKYPDELAAALEAEFGVPERSNSFKVYDEHIMLRDNRLWIADDTRKLTNVLDAAASKPATSSKSIMATFAAENTAIDISLNPSMLFASNPYARAMGIDIKALAQSHISYRATLDKNKLKIVATTFDETGDKMAIGDLMTPIDASFIKFMPGKPDAAFAFGKVSDELISQVLGDVPSMQRNLVEPYFKAVNGTFAIAASMPEELNRFTDPAAWSFTLAVGYDESKAGELLRMAAGLNGNGVTVRQLADQLCVTFNGSGMPNIFIAYKEGYLVASTQPVSSTNDGLDARHFNKYFAAGILSVPADGKFGKAVQLPFGVKGRMECDDEEMNSITEFEGSPYGFIESIISLATDRALQRRIIEAVAATSGEGDAADYTEWE